MFHWCSVPSLSCTQGSATVHLSQCAPRCLQCRVVAGAGPDMQATPAHERQLAVQAQRGQDGAGAAGAAGSKRQRRTPQAFSPKHAQRPRKRPQADKGVDGAAANGHAKPGRASGQRGPQSLISNSHMQGCNCSSWARQASPCIRPVGCPLEPLKNPGEPWSLGAMPEQDTPLVGRHAAAVKT